MPLRMHCWRWYWNCIVKELKFHTIDLKESSHWMPITRSHPLIRSAKKFIGNWYPWASQVITLQRTWMNRLPPLAVITFILSTDSTGRYSILASLKSMKFCVLPKSTSNSTSNWSIQVANLIVWWPWVPFSACSDNTKEGVLLFYSSSSSCSR